MAREIPTVPLAERVAVNAVEAGALIGRSDNFVREQIRQGHLRPVPHCDYTLIAVDELRRWAAAS
jgi:hypothetical protein